MQDNPGGELDPAVGDLRHYKNSLYLSVAISVRNCAIISKEFWI